MTHSHKPTRLPLGSVLSVQILFVSAFAASWCLTPGDQRQRVIADLLRRPAEAIVPLDADRPAGIRPLYDDPSMITDEQLAKVLECVLPRFSREELRPNLVEHALRIWGPEIEFDDPEIMSGPEMVQFLTDSGSYRQSWGEATEPVLTTSRHGVAVRWGTDAAGSVHHDHLVACLTEAGVRLDHPVFLPGHNARFGDLVREALTGFRLDEAEVEWSAMAFGFWLAPQNVSRWETADSRVVSLDLLADRLMRGDRRRGVCLGTHRVYSLVVLLRLDDEYGPGLLSEHTRANISDFLTEVRDLLTANPSYDGEWPSNWADGADSASLRDPKDPPYRTVIATGHHLEWLAFAPKEFHPPESRIRAAADWVIRATLEADAATIRDHYTYYSHVGNALASWRGMTPAGFREQWRRSHPGPAGDVETEFSDSAVDSSSVPDDH